jgi:AcrR family transcriptional regulator
MLMAAKRTGSAADGAVRARRLRAAPPTPAERDQGPIGYPQIAQIQRARILAAMVSVAGERGAAHTSVADITARCGVSRRTFYELFSDRDDCFLAAFEDALSLATARVLPAVRAERAWLEQLRAGIVALMAFLDEQPKLGRLLVCESLVAGRPALASRMQVARQLAEFVNEGRHESKLGKETPLIYAEGAVGGVLSILQNLLAQDEHEPYTALASTFTAMLVMPYLGTAAAQRELDRPIPVPATARHDEQAHADPFKHAGMRLTYRTIRVLTLIAELGGRGMHPSNRTLGDLAGIRDQGQISKLLSRLKRLGLIDNGQADRGQGAPNAWTLTAAGRALVDSVSRHTDSQPHDAT